MKLTRRAALLGFIGNMFPKPVRHFFGLPFYPVKSELFANKLVSVQPMKTPTAALFFLDYRYEKPL